MLMNVVKPLCVTPVSENIKQNILERNLMNEGGVVNPLPLGENPYKCSQCSKVYSQSGHLQVHKRTHIRE